MRNALTKSVAIAALTLTTSAAGAADTHYGAPGTFTWSGLYAGFHFGYATGQSDVFIDQVVPISVSFDPDGFIGGVQIGVNHEMANRFVLGVEADITYSAVKASAASNLIGLLETEMAWSGSARLRAGYALGRTLPYLAAGIAAASYRFGGLDLATGNSITFYDETQLGWTVGAGVEHAFTDHWIARLEYRYTDFGKHEMPVISALAGPNSIDLKTHDIRVGLSYKF